MKAANLIEKIKRVTANKKVPIIAIDSDGIETKMYTKTPAFIGLVKFKSDIPEMLVAVDVNKFIDALGMMSDVVVNYNRPTITLISDKISIDKMPTMKFDEVVPLNSFKDGLFYYKKGTIEPDNTMKINGSTVISISSSSIEKDLPDYQINKDGVQKIFDSFNSSQYEIKNNIDVIEFNIKPNSLIHIRDYATDVFKIISEIGGVWDISWNDGYPVNFHTVKNEVEYYFLIAQVKVEE